MNSQLKILNNKKVIDDTHIKADKKAAADMIDYLIARTGNGQMTKFNIKVMYG